MTDRRIRRGFALMTVLWTLIGVSSITIVTCLLARRGVAAASNVIALRRAEWAAQACASVLMDAADNVLRAAAPNIRDPQQVWRNLDVRVGRLARSEGVAECIGQVESNGVRLDLNRASASDLARLFVQLDLTAAACDSLDDAILDWRDADDSPRQYGAEANWYVAAHRQLPRNGPYGDERELQLVKGIDALKLEQRAILDSTLGVRADPIDLWHAPGRVLATLPGFSPTVASAVITLRAQSPGFMDLLQLLAALPSFARDSVLANYSELIGRVATQPEHWILIARGSSGEPTVSARLEILLGLSGTRAVVVRRRFWIE